MAATRRGERAKRPGHDRVKVQFSIPHELLIRLDLLAGKERVTRSAMLEELIADKVKGVVISYRGRQDGPIESAA